MSQQPSPTFRQALGAELRANLRLALPLIGAQLAAIGMGAIDTVFAGRLGPQALAAVAVGVNLNALFFVFAMGLLMACSPMVSHMTGAGRPLADIAVFARRARRLSLGVALVWVLGLNAAAGPVLGHLKLAPETARVAVLFTRVLSASAPGTCLWFALRFCAEGWGHTRPILPAGLVGLACNAALDWLLLFGHWGLPRCGVIGCAIATTVSSLAMYGVLLPLYRRGGLLQRPEAAVAAAVTEGAADILRLGLPVALLLTAEAGLFILAAMLMARFGDAVMAAYQVAINFASLVFMIPLGVGMATAVRVGHAAGAGDVASLRFRGLVGMGLGLANAVPNALLMVFLGGFIAALYTADAGIAAEAAGYLLFCAAFQFFDGLQSTANGALRGLKDTRVPMLVTLVAYWLVGMPVCLWLAFHRGQGPAGLWIGMTAGLGVAAAGLSARFWWRAGRAQLPIRSELMA